MNIRQTISTQRSQSRLNLYVLWAAFFSSYTLYYTHTLWMFFIWISLYILNDSLKSEIKLNKCPGFVLFSKNLELHSWSQKKQDTSSTRQNQNEWTEGRPSHSVVCVLWPPSEACGLRSRQNRWLQLTRNECRNTAGQLRQDSTITCPLRPTMCFHSKKSINPTTVGTNSFSISFISTSLQIYNLVVEVYMGFTHTSCIHFLKSQKECPLIVLKYQN